MIWLGIIKTFFFSSLKKLASPMGILSIVLTAVLTYGVWAAKDYLTGLKTSVTDLTELTTTLSAQNKMLITVSKENAIEVAAFKKNVELSDNITEELIEKVESIQNVKITEKTIIQAAKSNCLDEPYPDTIIHSGVLRWEQETPDT